MDISPRGYILDIYQYIWDYNLQSEIRAEQQSVD